MHPDFPTPARPPLAVPRGVLRLSFPATPRHRVLAGAVLALLATAAHADDEPAVTPYRPSVSTPAALSAPGWLEVEVGLQSDHAARSARRDSLPYALKLAFTPDWGIRLGGEAWVRQDAGAGERLSGVGDTSLVLKRRFAVDEARAFGVELGATLPTGHHAVSSGKSDYTLNGIYSADVGSLHTDLNLAATRLGRVEGGASRLQALWAASLSGSLTERWGWVGELSGTQQRGVEATRQALVAASYTVSKTLALDAGLAHSLRAGDGQWSVFCGFTVLTARLF
ncbi:transporter [Ideonella sp. BN130291]|uniref:transporter n=1 Tax=Ideonella sp. BN130291 TaxID=3112940 RepID=UPI002E276C51|nr:transporter [Ideonella sp. BN130291]